MAEYCRRENKPPLGFVEVLNGKVRVIQRSAYDIRDEEYFSFMFFTSMLPP
jgi:hypothetical protein